MAEALRARISVRVHPGARKTGLAGMVGDQYKLNIAAPPTEGRANEACVAYLAELAGMRPSSVRLIHGLTNRNKVFEFEGISLETLRFRLESTK